MIFCTSIYKFHVNCLLIIAELNNVLIINDTITSTRFVDTSNNVQSALNRMMIQRAKYQWTKKNALIVKAIISFHHFNAKSKHSKKTKF
jgi:hypothetical protein